MSVRARRLAVVALAAAGLAPSLACPQVPTAADLEPRVADLVADLETTLDCDVSIHGAPRYDDFSTTWLVAYSAAGEQCDEMTDALRAGGVPLEVTFFRRPNLDQVKGLIGTMRRSIERGFGCRIALKGEPRFNEDSTVWSVDYLVSDNACIAAGEELERQGAEHRVWFLRVRTG